MNVVETIDTSKKPHDELAGIRPTETEADLIAACAPWQNPAWTAQELMKIKDDVCPGAEGGCRFCDPDEHEEFTRDMQAYWESQLAVHNVSWDPTLRL